MYVICSGGQRALLSPLRSGVEGRGKLCGQMPAAAAETAAKRGSNPPPLLDICLGNEMKWRAGGGWGAGSGCLQSSAIWGGTVQYVTQEAAHGGRNE